ncbi:MAG: hypothetical protein DSO03_05380 [Hadesarchaea archaeon]|nr:MAG: hypothetical protein DSO03_05380 [Hadesarchaea archaeon]
MVREGPGRVLAVVREKGSWTYSEVTLEEGKPLLEQVVSFLKTGIEDLEIPEHLRDVVRQWPRF